MWQANLRSERLILAPLEIADFPTIQRIFSQWEVVRFLSDDVPWPYPADGARWFVEDHALPLMAKGSEMHWSIRLRAAPASLIGLISLRPYEDTDDQRGFWLDPAHQGQGLMFEAAEVVTRFAFEELGIESLLLNNTEPNFASARIKQKQGAMLVRTERGSFVSGNFDKQIWRLDRENWRGRFQPLAGPVPAPGK
jgi:RimJ/RimL family protein N-acetyltransferase